MDTAAALFVDLGVLDEAAVAPFRRRLEEAIVAGDRIVDGPVDEGLARRARRLLGRRLAAVAERPGLPRMPAESDPVVSGDPAHNQAVSRFEELLQACGACRGLSEAELSRWATRLREVDDGRSWRLEQDRRRRSCRLTDLRAVVAGEADPAGAIRIASAELYSDGVILRWHERGGSLQPPAHECGCRRSR